MNFTQLIQGILLPSGNTSCSPKSQIFEENLLLSGNKNMVFFLSTAFIKGFLLSGTIRAPLINKKILDT